ncbi:MAG: septum site-determining protein MinC [Pleurocapsa sp. SU_196_0]|nr:septum site-determining protein MinC [Pleurocapsa sp. SU_196_0]
MKLRGTAGGLNLLLEPLDTPDSVAAMLESRAALLTENVEIELGGAVSAVLLETVMGFVRNAGGVVTTVRPPREGNTPAPQRTEVIGRTMRAGTRREVSGNVIVLGDVNPGVELIAGGDVIVSGTIRGLVHAGSTGREDAIIWAGRIAAPQIRLAHAMARAPEGSTLDNLRHQETDVAEVVRLEGGQIVIEPYRA